jgi:hypothetical protein
VGRTRLLLSPEAAVYINLGEFRLGCRVRQIRVALLIGSRKRRGRRPDGTKALIVPEFTQVLTWHRERFVLCEYRKDLSHRWEVEDWKNCNVEVRYYVRIAYRVSKAVEEQITQDDFEDLLTKAYVL